MIWCTWAGEVLSWWCYLSTGWNVSLSVQQLTFEIYIVWRFLSVLKHIREKKRYKSRRWYSARMLCSFLCHIWLIHMETSAKPEPHQEARALPVTGCCHDMTQNASFSMLPSQSCSHALIRLQWSTSDCWHIALCKVTSKPWWTCVWTQRRNCFRLLKDSAFLVCVFYFIRSYVLVFSVYQSNILAI